MNPLPPLPALSVPGILTGSRRSSVLALVSSKKKNKKIGELGCFMPLALPFGKSPGTIHGLDSEVYIS